MKQIDKRQGIGYEVQFYDDRTGNASHAVSLDSVEELAQLLARCCWGQNLGKHLPTVWKDGKKWCFGEYSPANETPSAIPCVVISHSFDSDGIVYGYDTDEEADEALVRLYGKYLEEEKNNDSPLYEANCYCVPEEGYGQIEWVDGCLTHFTHSYVMKEDI